MNKSNGLAAEEAEANHNNANPPMDTGEPLDDPILSQFSSLQFEAKTEVENDDETDVKRHRREFCVVCHGRRDGSGKPVELFFEFIWSPRGGSANRGKVLR